MRRRRPPLYSVLALWLSCTLSATAQEFYIELRGPETPAASAVQPPAAQPPAPVAPAQRHGPVRSTDTLWSIAAQHTRAPATVQQTMVALYYLNPGAFVRGNINYLQRGATLTLPTLTQARQRSPREAEAEFRRLSRQGNRTAARAPASQPVARPAPKPAEPVAAATPAPARPAPAVATPPAAAKPDPKPASNGLSEPRTVQAQPPEPQPKKTQPAVRSVVAEQADAASEAPVAAGAQQAEQTALAKLQTQLLDELREQVAMSNEQLAELSNNNQALRKRLGQLTAEVNELKQTRSDSTPPPAAQETDENWLTQLLKQPLNLAILLTLPVLLLLALFTLWWRRRTKQELAEQDKDSSDQMIEEDNNDFDDLFAVELPANEVAGAEQEAPGSEDEPEIDEDAFARFLEEQQQLEEEEAAQALNSDSGQQEDVLFDDEVTGQEQEEDVLFDDEVTGQEQQEDVLFDDEVTGQEQAEDIVFDDEETGQEQAEDILFDDEAAAMEKATLPEDEAAIANNNSEPAPQEPGLTQDKTEEFNAFEEELLDLDEPAPQTASAPESLAEQGAFNKEPDEFDDILSGTVAEQEADALSAMQAGSGSPFAEARDPMVRQELDDYADLLGNSQDVDIDADEGGMGAKLDLARAYIEIDDIDSARELLNEALEKGNEQHQNDARKLLQRLDKR